MTLCKSWLFKQITNQKYFHLFTSQKQEKMEYDALRCHLLLRHTKISDELLVFNDAHCRHLMLSILYWRPSGIRANDSVMYISLAIILKKSIEHIFVHAPVALKVGTFTGSGWQNRALQQESNLRCLSFKKFTSFSHLFPFWLVSPVTGVSRLDDQIFINRNPGVPSVVKFHPFNTCIAVADKDSIWSGPQNTHWAWKTSAALRPLCKWYSSVHMGFECETGDVIL